VVGSGAFVEAEARGRDEAMAREGMCPGCRRPGFLGQGIDREGGRVGSCLCRHCWAIWWYTLGARRHWRGN